MIKILFFILYSFLLSLPGCGNNKSSAEPAIPRLTEDDLEGNWRGNLTNLNVPLTWWVTQPSELELKELQCQLEFEQTFYFMDLNYNSDTLVFEYSEWGQWELESNNPGKIIFKSKYGNYKQHVESTHREVTELGGDAIISEAWKCDYKYEDDSLMFYNIEGGSVYGEMVLVKVPEPAS